jgi:outer membrane protein assembly factor BamB
LWVNCYDGSGHSDDGARAIAISPDGTTVVVSGELTGSTSGLDFGTEAMNAQTGAQQWVRPYNGPANGTDQAVAVAFSPDGSQVFVTGPSAGSGTGLDYATEALTASCGAVQWIRRYNGPANGDDQPVGLAVSPDGSRVFVTGTSDGGVSTGMDYVTVAYAANNGAIDWVRRFAGAGADTASGIAATADGKAVVVAGTSTGVSSGQDYYTVVYSQSTGARLWAARYGSGAGNNDQLVAIGASPDSSKIYVTGTIPTSSGHAFSTIAYNASTGTKLWLIHFEPTFEPDSVAEVLAVDPDGSKVVVAGHDGAASETVAYNASTGARAWTRLLAFPTGSDPLGLAVSADGRNVFLTGTSGSGFDTAQLAAATGAEIGNGLGWTRSTAANSEGVVSSPDSHFIYVTGESLSSTTGSDFTTVEYGIFTNP